MDEAPWAFIAYPNYTMARKADLKGLTYYTSNNIRFQDFSRAGAEGLETRRGGRLRPGLHGGMRRAAPTGQAAPRPLLRAMRPASARAAPCAAAPRLGFFLAALRGHLRFARSATRSSSCVVLLAHARAAGSRPYPIDADPSRLSSAAGLATT